MLVVLGHCAGSLSDPVNCTILSFHMPLFFFISGLSNQAGGDKKESFIQYFWKRVRGIIVPQMVLFLINIAYYFVSQQQITITLIAETWFNWFFTVLFLCSLLLWVLKKTELIPCWYICLPVAVILMVLTQVTGINTVVHIETVPMAMIFYLAGIYSYRWMTQERNSRLESCWIFLLPLIIISAYWNSPVMMYNNEYGNLFLFTISSVSGIMLCYELAKRITDNALLLWFGQSSLGIYVFHVRIINALHAVGHRFWPGIENYSHPAYWHYFLMALLVLIPLVFLVEKYLPFLVGKRRVRTEYMDKMSKPLTRGGGRDHSIDVAKCLLIFLVVWGHAIQYLHGTEFDFWEDTIFKFIYGFHMPLFALISGYLMCGSFTKYGAGKLVGKRAKQLLIPTIGWALVLTVLDVILNVLTHESNSASWILRRFISRAVNDLWFLKAMFIACIMVVLIEKFCKGHWIVYSICMLLTLLLPSIYNFALYGFVLPFFMVGFKTGGAVKRWNDDQNRKRRIGIFVTSLIVYIILLLFFHKENYIYTTGLSVLNSDKGPVVQLGLDLYRAVVALIGCVMILEGSTLITSQKNWITNISSKTMIIYIVTASIFTYIPQFMSRVGMKAVLGSIPPVVVDLVILIPVSVALILLALLVEKFIEKIKLGKVLLGK